jgi:serine/threonine-protein kinase HipA
MIKLDIWLTFPDGKEIQVGEMVCGNPDQRGRLSGAFRYTPGFLSHSRAFAIDPVSLPLSGMEFPVDRPSGVFSVFEDSLPDDWGRRLLVREAKIPMGRQTLPNLLLALGARGLGALSYFETAQKPSFKYNYIREIRLEKLLIAVEKYEKGSEIEDQELRLLFQAGSSPGGARPKAIVKADDALWIAKFPSVKDMVNVVRIEAATLSLAQKAGVNVPEFRLAECAGRDVLMVRRFDISDQGGFFHMISMGTLLQVEGWYNASYKDIFKLLRLKSSRPEIDIPAMYRQMVFNALIGNTDDHLKNFSMLHGDSGYFLSPAYDLLPDIAQRREHVLYFELDHFFPGLSELVNIGKKIGVSKASKVAAEISGMISDWKTEFKKYGVPDEDIKRLEWGIDRRLGLGK